MEGKIVYFENVGREDREAKLRITDETLSIAKERAEELGIRNILVATTGGDSAARAVEVLKGLRVIVVSHMTGHREPDTQELTEENRKIVESKDVVILTTAHAFAGVDRAIRSKYSWSPLAIVSSTLSIFGPGMKVACEIALMAADAGLIRTDEDVIAIAGNTRGADTAVVVRPVNSSRFFDLDVKEILCKPLSAKTPRREETDTGRRAEHHH
ncbi:MAG: pyruvate kinase alpha/beta domain-containing protein [Dehalococcoidales bacterium]|nr:pyruvate kinase alpha/beta domain-containing protein [Dehalococcoidales bacterium]